MMHEAAEARGCSESKLQESRVACSCSFASRVIYPRPYVRCTHYAAEVPSFLHTHTKLMPCSMLHPLAQGQALHAHTLLSSPFASRVPSSLCTHSAITSTMPRHIFDHLKKQDVCVWNVMISAYTRLGRGKKAFELFDAMEQASG